MISGAAIGMPFANTLVSNITGRKYRDCVDAHDYLQRIGYLIEYYSKEAAARVIGPMHISDNAIPNHPIDMDVIPSGFPSFGINAATTSYQINLQFEILDDYVGKYDVSQNSS